MNRIIPDNWKIHYYLGNLFYDKIPERAVAEWEKCARAQSGIRDGLEKPRVGALEAF